MAQPTEGVADDQPPRIDHCARRAEHSHKSVNIGIFDLHPAQDRHGRQRRPKLPERSPERTPVERHRHHRARRHCRARHVHPVIHAAGRLEAHLAVRLQFRQRGRAFGQEGFEHGTIDALADARGQISVSGMRVGLRGQVMAAGQERAACRICGRTAHEFGLLEHNDFQSVSRREQGRRHAAHAGADHHEIGAFTCVAAGHHRSGPVLGAAIACSTSNSTSGSRAADRGRRPSAALACKSAMTAPMASVSMSKTVQ